LQTLPPNPQDFTPLLKRLFSNIPKDSAFVVDQDSKEIAWEPNNAASGPVLILSARNLEKGEKSIKVDNEVRYKVGMLSTPKQALKRLVGSNVTEKKRIIGGIEWRLTLRELGEGEVVGDYTREFRE
jgi:hypothetical protein